MFSFNVEVLLVICAALVTLQWDVNNCPKYVMLEIVLISTARTVGCASSMQIC